MDHRRHRRTAGRSAGHDAGLIGDGDRVRVGDLELAGVNTRTLSVEGDGPPILLLHGYTDSADTWRYVLAELAARGRAGIAVDLPGHGRAGVHEDAPILPQLRRFTSALVEHHPGSVVAGNSLGGLSAMLAAEDPNLPIAGIVAIGPAGLGYRFASVCDGQSRAVRRALRR